MPANAVGGSTPLTSMTTQHFSELVRARLLAAFALPMGGVWICSSKISARDVSAP
jgi:hypothetical protein